MSTGGGASGKQWKGECGDESGSTQEFHWLNLSERRGQVVMLL